MQNYVMKLVILGSGTSQISRERVSSSHYLEIGGKKVIIVAEAG